MIPDLIPAPTAIAARAEVRHAGHLGREYVRGGMDPTYSTPAARDAYAKHLGRRCPACAAAFLTGWVLHHPDTLHEESTMTTTDTPPDLPWSMESWIRFLQAAAERDTDALVSWLGETITSPTLEWTLLSALPITAGILAANLADLGERDYWALATCDGAAPEHIGVGQLLTAGMNQDQDAVTAHVKALFDHPLPARGEVLGSLIDAVGLVLHTVHRRTPDSDILLRCDGCLTHFRAPDIADQRRPDRAALARASAAQAGWTSPSKSVDHCPACTAKAVA